MESLSFVQDIDAMKMPPEFETFKRADFLIDEGKAIVEQKWLRSDPEYKVHNELDKHKDRKEYPLFYGKWELQKILKHLPDGEEINGKLFLKISRSIEQSVREANRQLKETKVIFDCPRAIGILVLLNEDVSVLSPEIIASRVSQLLAKTHNGRLCYSNITAVWFLMENYSRRAHNGQKLLPSVVINGPTAKNNTELTTILERLQSNWSIFTGIPRIKGQERRISDSDFETIAHAKGQERSAMKLHDSWREQYHASRYLANMNDGDVLRYGSKLMSSMLPHFLKGGRKIPPSELEPLLIKWTHFLEEMNIRGLDLKKMPKI